MPTFQMDRLPPPPARPPDERPLAVPEPLGAQLTTATARVRSHQAAGPGDAYALAARLAAGIAARVKGTDLETRLSWSTKVRRTRPTDGRAPERATPVLLELQWNDAPDVITTNRLLPMLILNAPFDGMAAMKFAQALATFAKDALVAWPQLAALYCVPADAIVRFGGFQPENLEARPLRFAATEFAHGQLGREGWFYEAFNRRLVCSGPMGASAIRMHFPLRVCVSVIPTSPAVSA
jgi:hypothetical protein